MTASWSLDDVDLIRIDILASRLAAILKSGDVVALSQNLSGEHVYLRNPFDLIAEKLHADGVFALGRRKDFQDGIRSDSG